jgi:hypothetical protein
METVSAPARDCGRLADHRAASGRDGFQGHPASLTLERNVPNHWFRFYAEFEDDAKVQMISEADQRRLVLLFCERCKEQTLTDVQRSFKWRVSVDEVLRTKQIFIDCGFIDENWNLLHWDKRQAPSDFSRERTKRWRTKSKTHVTASDRHGDGDVTGGDKRCDGAEESRVEESRVDKKRIEKSRGDTPLRGDLLPLSSIISSSRTTPRHFPATVPALIAGGYSLSNRRPCRECGVDIDWWITPKGGQIPMNQDSAVVHMETCAANIVARGAN